MGVFVAQPRQNLSKKARRDRLLGSLDQLLVEAVRLGFVADELVDLVSERIQQFRWNEAPAQIS
jgi:GntR family transcriptional regulator